jgi:hypothetical protein
VLAPTLQQLSKIGLDIGAQHKASNSSSRSNAAYASTSSSSSSSGGGSGSSEYSENDSPSSDIDPNVKSKIRDYFDGKVASNSYC